MTDVIEYVPEYSEAFEAYTVKAISKNMWRFARHCAFEDLKQDSYLLFLELKKRYTGKVDNPAWFMALYKTSLANLFTDLSVKATKEAHEVSNIVYKDDEEVDLYNDSIGELENDALAGMMLEKLTGEARDALVLLIQMPSEIRIALEKSWYASGRKKPFCNDHLKQLMGLDPKNKMNIHEQWRIALENI